VITRADIVAEARSWLDTPFQHQGRVKFVGVDCVGLVLGVAKALGIHLVDSQGYPRTPDGKSLQAACESQLIRTPLEQMQPGDVALFRFQVDPQHVAILGDYPHGGLSLIHAYNTIGKVVEANLSGAERRRIVAVYSLPGVGA
jgi:NlpC/P60 family putative phage cell wall peptidase